MLRNTFLFMLGLLVLTGCEQSDPPDIGRDGDVLTFAGRQWDVKSSEVQVGPGPNWFSREFKDVFVDENGWLHLNIVKNGLNWNATEVVGQDVVGYGTYTWVVGSDVLNLPENLVVGLFTWDNNTFQEAANSEVDIEFSKWGDTSATTTLTYSVQPVNFGTYFPERTHYALPQPEVLTGVTTHSFTWTETLITWQSWVGDSRSGEPYYTWTFDLNNPARAKQEGGNISDAIIIPEPGETTNARMNFWILPHIDLAPTDGQEHELIIRDFIYEPL